MDAVREWPNFDPVIQGVNTRARINHPQFIQAKVGDRQMHRAGGGGRIRPFEFHADPFAVNFHQQVEF